MPFITAADNTPLYYETAGSGRPLVFLHGWAMSGRVFMSLPRSCTWNPDVRNIAPTTSGFSLPTQAMRNGDFSGLMDSSGRKYTVYDYADPATKKFCVVIPEGLKTVRGLLVECNYAGGDSRGDWTFCTYYREFMHLHGFGLVASAGDIPHVKAFQAFRNCLQMVSMASKHPELVNAPYAAVGFSAGGGFASTLMTRDPERTIAAGIIEARYNYRPSFARPGDYVVISSTDGLARDLIDALKKEPGKPLKPSPAAHSIAQIDGAQLHAILSANREKIPAYFAWRRLQSRPVAPDEADLAGRHAPGAARAHQLADGRYLFLGGPRTGRRPLRF